MPPTTTSTTMTTTSMATRIGTGASCELWRTLFVRTYRSYGGAIYVYVCILIYKFAPLFEENGWQHYWDSIFIAHRIAVCCVGAAYESRAKCLCVSVCVSKRRRDACRSLNRKWEHGKNRSVCVWAKSVRKDKLNGQRISFGCFAFTLNRCLRCLCSLMSEDTETEWRISGQRQYAKAHCANRVHNNHIYTDTNTISEETRTRLAVAESKHSVWRRQFFVDFSILKTALMSIRYNGESIFSRITAIKVMSSEYSQLNAVASTTDWESVWIHGIESNINTNLVNVVIAGGAKNKKLIIIILRNALLPRKPFNDSSKHNGSRPYSRYCVAYKFSNYIVAGLLPRVSFLSTSCAHR